MPFDGYNSSAKGHSTPCSAMHRDGVTFVGLNLNPGWNHFLKNTPFSGLYSATHTLTFAPVSANTLSTALLITTCTEKSCFELMVDQSFGLRDRHEELMTNRLTLYVVQSSASAVVSISEGCESVSTFLTPLALLRHTVGRCSIFEQCEHLLLIPLHTV